MHQSAVILKMKERLTISKQTCTIVEQLFVTTIQRIFRYVKHHHMSTPNQALLSTIHVTKDSQFMCCGFRHVFDQINLIERDSNITYSSYTSNKIYITHFNCSIK
ncbi:hypothetical protein KC19_5G096500 [Ceratodon purpureus]|uniref:Uncharacterized protein n=1 Tax=Ceratodon purpureus TaxID=3225 RepID=A0A8T0HZQ9_CERPU|nr:hypothetical protein KC19_5G096500 [Ceratodon purpureus]